MKYNFNKSKSEIIKSKNLWYLFLIIVIFNSFVLSSAFYNINYYNESSHEYVKNIWFGLSCLCLIVLSASSYFLFIASSNKSNSVNLPAVEQLKELYEKKESCHDRIKLIDEYLFLRELRNKRNYYSIQLLKQQEYKKEFSLRISLFRDVIIELEKLEKKTKRKSELDSIVKALTENLNKSEDSFKEFIVDYQSRLKKLTYRQLLDEYMQLVFKIEKSSKNNKNAIGVYNLDKSHELLEAGHNLELLLFMLSRSSACLEKVDDNGKISFNKESGSLILSSDDPLNSILQENLGININDIGSVFDEVLVINKIIDVVNPMLNTAENHFNKGNDELAYKVIDDVHLYVQEKVDELKGVA